MPRPDVFFAGIDTSENNAPPYSGPAARDAGVQVWVARCTVGWGRRDPAYLLAKMAAEEVGIDFGPYGLNWPINRNPVREAEFLIRHCMPPEAPTPPRIVAGDFELGTNTDAAGNEKVTGRELIEQVLAFTRRLRMEFGKGQGIDVAAYSGMWWLLHPKMQPFLAAYLKDLAEIDYWLAEYPFQGWGLKAGETNIHPDTFDPWTIRASLPATPKLATFVTLENLLAWQWTSLGNQAGIASNRGQWAKLDRNVFYRRPGGPPPPPPPFWRDLTPEEQQVFIERALIATSILSPEGRVR